MRPKNQGFTLLEVLIALAILVGSIVAVMQLFPRSLLQARMAAERTVTAELANSVLGQIRATGAEAVYNRQLPRALLTMDAIYTVEGTYGLYHNYSTTVQRLNGASETFLQRITFVVDMPDGRQEKFTTFVSKQ